MKVFSVDSAPARRSQTLRIGAWNIAHGRGAVEDISNFTDEPPQERRARLDRIAEQIRSLELDVVVLNEVDFDCTWSGRVNQAAYLAKASGYPFRVEQRNWDVRLPFLRLAFGNAVLSRIRIEGAELLRYPALSDVERLFVGHKQGALVELANGISLVAVHLEHRDESVRIASTKTFHVDESVPTVLIGDFNSTRTGFPEAAAGGTAVDTLLSQGFSVADNQPVPNRFTFSALQPRRIIDWLFVKNLEVTSFTVDKSIESDHRLIWGQVRLPEARR